MNTETKQPAAGEYWEIAALEPYRVRIIAVDKFEEDTADVLVRKSDGSIDTWMSDDELLFTEHARHLPDCDSFDWKETVYPRYAVPSGKSNDTLFDHHSYFIKESECDPWKGVLISGRSFRSHFRDTHLEAGYWKIVSKEEAEARHARLHREWVVSQLLVIDREKWPDHVPRVGVDWRRDYVDRKPDSPIDPVVPLENYSGNLPAIKYYENSIHYCLPKDLPPEPHAAVSPGRSFRTVKMGIIVSGTTLYVCKLPLTVDGPVSVEFILDDLDPAKVVSRTVHLVNEEEF